MLPMRPTARALVALALTCVSLAPAPVRASAPAPQRLTLANGLRVVLAPDPMASGVDVAVWYPVGTRLERDGQAGITHLVERLSFRGSARVRDGEHRERILAEGGSLNTNATADHVCFWQTVPSEALARTLALEADRMAGLTPTPAAFEEERREAVLDRARAERTAVARGLARLWAEAYAGHPYARPITGLEADLRTLTLADAQRWRRDRFTAGTAVLTVVGRFEPEPTRERIEALFGRLPRGAKLAAPPAPALAAGPRRAEETADVPVRVLFMGFRGPGSSDPDAPALELLAEILGGGESSLLMQVLGEQWSLALAAQAGFDARREGSLLWVLAAIRDDAEAETAERVMRDELARIAREGVGEDAVTRARQMSETRILFAAQGVRATAQALGEAELAGGGSGAADGRAGRIRTVTAADVQRAAQRVMAGGASAVVWVRPAAGGAR